MSGTLNQITYSDCSFRLDLASGDSLAGMLDPKFLDQEALRPHWGNQVTVEGIVHFKTDGKPRLIYARRVIARVDGDHVFKELPTQSKLFDPEKEKRAIAFDPKDLAGLWPGDETIEELLDLLD